MKAEILTIGDELLLGQVIDTNSSWLGQELNTLGIEVHYKSAIRDDKHAILRALSEASQRSQVVVMTGGLGPTKDDITKVTLCEYFKTQLVNNKQVQEWVEEIFRNRNLPMLTSNSAQAMVPANCEVLWNRNGTAPGMWFSENGVIYVSMPGVPFEMKAIFSEEVLPRLKQNLSLPSIVHRTLLTIGIGESFLAKKIADVEEALPSHIRLAYLPAVGAVRLRFSAYGSDQRLLEEEIAGFVNKVYDIAGSYIYGEGELSIQEAVGQLLLRANASVATAESCTGGYLSHLITSIPGASRYYAGSIISYDNRIKTSELNVGEELLKEHGAVSEACVRVMASEVRQKMGTTYGLATSGIAGPGGGTPEKPVGTVWIALATPEKTEALEFKMGDNRERTIHRSALSALDMLRKELNQHGL